MSLETTGQESHREYQRADPVDFAPLTDPDRYVHGELGGWVEVIASEISGIEQPGSIAKLGLGRALEYRPDRLAEVSALQAEEPESAVIPPDFRREEPEQGPAYHVEHHPEDGDTKVYVTSRITLEDTKRVVAPEYEQKLEDLIGASRGLKIREYNATPAGGGVARINKVRAHWLENIHGLDYKWHALKMNEAASEVTKYKFHNVLQNVEPEGTVLTEKDKIIYEAMIAENFELMKEDLADADVIFIDDWQPTGLIPYIKGGWEETSKGYVWHEGINPNAILIVQDHIQTKGNLMVTPGTAQEITWDYLWNHNRIKAADAFPTHPVDDFRPRNVPKEMVVYMTANCDLQDDFHRDMAPQEIRDAFDFLNNELWLNEDQKPIELDERLEPVRPFNLVSARMDEAKGLPQAIEMYLKERALHIANCTSVDRIPQLVMQAFGSVDDPSGTMILKDMMNLRKLADSLDPAIYGHNVMDDIKIIRTPQNELALNALMWKANVYFQPSIEEGMEDAVSGALFHGKVVLGSNRGGIPKQIVHGENGFVFDPYDTGAWAQEMYRLNTDELHNRRMQKRVKELAESYNYHLITTAPNIINFLGLIKLLREDREGFEGNERWPAEILYPEDKHLKAA